MDYSSIAQDPTEPSPWGSPRVEHAGFPIFNNSDVPPAPLPVEQSASSDQDSHRDSPRPRQSNDEEREPNSPDVSERLQNAHLNDSGYSAEQTAFSTEQHQPSPSQRTQTPSRYHPGARQQSKPQQAVYKIQAKITGLERTGKKDPILRFDVHVSVPIGRSCLGYVDD